MYDVRLFVTEFVFIK